jgi:hypothetical protein
LRIGRTPATGFPPIEGGVNAERSRTLLTAAALGTFDPANDVIDLAVTLDS